MQTTIDPATAQSLPADFNFATKAERDEGHEHVIGRKCGMCESPAVWYFAGGATTFDEFDRFTAAQEVQQAVEGQMSVFDALLYNIRSNETLDARAKAAAIGALAAELDTRIAEARREEEAEQQAEGTMAEEAGEASLSEPVRVEGGVSYRSSDYADVLDSTRPETWGLRMADGASGHFTVPRIHNALVGMKHARGVQSLAGSRYAAAVRVEEAIGRTKAAPEVQEALRARLEAVRAESASSDHAATTSDPGYFAVFKDAKTGRPRWVAIHTNRYRDREGDIFSEASHKSFVEAVNAGSQPWPVLRPWHIPFDIGVTDFLDYDSKGFVVSSGTFLPGMEPVAEKLKALPNLGCSHGYLYRPSDYRDGVYHGYRSFEITVLPVDRAANTLTAFFAGKESEMPLNPARKEFLAAITSPEIADAIEGNIANLAEVAGVRGLSYKALGDDIEAINARLDGIDLATALTGRKDDAPAATAEATAPSADAPAAEAAPAGDAPAAAETAPETTEPVEPTAATAPTPTAEEQAAAAAAMAAAGLGEPPAADGAGGDAPATGGDESDPVVALEKSMHDAFARGVAPLVERLDAVAEELVGLRSTVSAQADEIVRLRGGADAHLADIIRPRIGPDLRGVRSSEQGPEASAEEAAAVEAMRPSGDGGRPGSQTPQRGEKDGPGAPAAAYVDDALAVVGMRPAPYIP